MGIKTKLKHAISFLLHGEAKPIYANIRRTCIVPWI